MKRSLSRVAVAIVLSALLVVGAVLPAAADGPISREPAFFGHITITDACAFPVEFAVVTQNKTETVWYRKGVYIGHGTGGGVYTWSANGITLTTKLHGDVQWFAYPDGSYTLIWNGNHGDTPFFIFGRGHTELHFGPGDVLLSASITNHNHSICELLTP